MFFPFILIIVIATECFGASPTSVTSTGFDLKKSEPLNGAHLSVAVFHSPPFMIISAKPDGNYTYSGCGKEVHDWLEKKLNFTTSFVRIDNTVVSEFESFFEYNLLLVANKVVDASAMAAVATPERRKLADFTHFVWAEPYAMLVPKPDEEAQFFAFIRPFQPIVWLLIFVTILVMVASMSLFSVSLTPSNNKVHQEEMSVVKKGRETRIFDYAIAYTIYILNILTNQGAKNPNISRTSFRILVGAWLLVAMVLVNSYSSTVISYLTVMKKKPAINTFEDLASSKEIGIIIKEDLIIGQQILNAQSGVLKSLGDQARHNPNRLFVDIANIQSRLETGRYAFPTLMTFCKFFVANKFRNEHKCRFQVTDSLPMYGFWSVTLQKGSKYTSEFNDALMKLWETGLTQFWMKNQIPPAPKCFARQKSASARQVPISLDRLSGAFFLLGFGLALSTLVFLVEIILGYRNQRQAAGRAVKTPPSINNVINVPFTYKILVTIDV